MIKAQVPIVPLALVGTHELLPMHTYHLAPRPLMLVACDPIETSGMTTRDADALTTRVLDAIAAEYYARSPLNRPETLPESQAKTPSTTRIAIITNLRIVYPPPRLCSSASLIQAA